jgi:hypothetical protein
MKRMDLLLAGTLVSTFITGSEFVITVRFLYPMRFFAISNTV